jgi:hypothetical protein
MAGGEAPAGARARALPQLMKGFKMARNNNDSGNINKQKKEVTAEKPPP